MRNFIKVALVMVLASASLCFCPPVKAEGTTHSITTKSVGAGVLSLLIWPGIGQAINDQPGKKVLWHAVVGIFPPFRFWSAYDGLYRRDGGYFEGKI